MLVHRPNVRKTAGKSRKSRSKLQRVTLIVYLRLCPSMNDTTHKKKDDGMTGSSSRVGENVLWLNALVGTSWFKVYVLEIIMFDYDAFL